MNSLLIIEDDDHLRQGIKTLLELKYPFLEVFEATEGSEALTLIQTKPIDMILLDGNLPGMLGANIAYFLKHDDQTKHITLIAMSGISPHDPHLNQLLRYCDGWLPKPFKDADLFAIMEVYKSPCDNTMAV